MIKKENMKPSVKVVKLQQKSQILVGNMDPNYGVNDTLIEDEEVITGW